uniref:Uncharacterized protein n=1 Tax=Salix viminalis TaxID=40686 RepID=A0A6N2MF33_SALVM
MTTFANEIWDRKLASSIMRSSSKEKEGLPTIHTKLSTDSLSTMFHQMILPFGNTVMCKKHFFSAGSFNYNFNTRNTSVSMSLGPTSDILNRSNASFQRYSPSTPFMLPAIVMIPRGRPAHSFTIDSATTCFVSGNNLTLCPNFSTNKFQASPSERGSTLIILWQSILVHMSNDLVVKTNLHPSVLRVSGSSVISTTAALGSSTSSVSPPIKISIPPSPSSKRGCSIAKPRTGVEAALVASLLLELGTLLSTGLLEELPLSTTDCINEDEMLLISISNG